MSNSIASVSAARQTRGRTIWLRWVLAHVLLLSIALSDLLAVPHPGFEGWSVLPFVAIALFLAEGIGLWGALHPPREIGLWLIASFAGWAAATALVLSSFTRSPSLVVAVIFGGVWGIAQWVVLQRHVTHAFWWIPANAAGIGAGGFIGSLLAESVRPFCQSTASCDSLAIVAGCVAGSAVFSIVTGTTLVWLLRHNHEGPLHDSAKSMMMILGPAIVVLGGVLIA